MRLEKPGKAILSPASGTILTVAGKPAHAFREDEIMVTSLSMRSNQTSKNTSQEELRDLMGKSPAAHRFLTLIDPSTILSTIGPFSFGSTARGPMVPDDPGPSEPDRVWRRLASAVSAGISYREPGLQSSPHISLRTDGANAHV